MAGPAVSNANYMDFFGETPEEEEERIRKEEAAKRSTPASKAAQDAAKAAQNKFLNMNAEALQDLPTSIRSTSGQQRSKDIASGARVVVTPPGQWGQFDYARQGKPASAYAANAPNDLGGDLLRLGGAATRILTNPINAVIGDYLPEEAQAAIGGPGYFTDALVDEGLDRALPAGSGDYGANIIPGRDGTGGDRFYPSETTQSGSYVDGYRGVGNPRVPTTTGSGGSGGSGGAGAGSGVVRPENYRSDAALDEIRAYLDAERANTGPSEAEALLKKATDRAAARSLGIAAGARGGAGARERARGQAVAANASLGATAAADLAALRAKEANTKKDREATVMGMLGPLAQAGDLRDLGYTEAEIRQRLGLGEQDLIRDKFNATTPPGLFDDPAEFLFNRLFGGSLNSRTI